ncbi:alpha/beta fold hydrolase [Agromyces sp. SYSU T0242]|uniref:alpha/beta fold hydrolase n=1 Tax=Agromyces litoreus TaxID=3158561 RepID=UPI0033963D12
MRAQRAHEVITDDRVAIRATVEGEGPPVVFLQGVMGDGDLDWAAVVPHVAGRFTCHLPSMRGRGRSGDHPNLRIDRIGADYETYVESLGEPAGLVGWSAGAGHALAVASRSAAVRATAAYEPMAGMLMDDEERAALLGALVRGGELVAQGDLPGGMRAIAEHPFTAEDLESADAAGYFEATGGYSPHVLRVFQQVAEYEGAMPEDPAVLGAIDTPVLVLHGSETSPFFAASARHVAGHVRDSRLHAIPGAGHIGPLTHPRAVGAELVDFFGAAFAAA